MLISFIGAPGSGKALDINTHIPTLNGIKFFKDIKVGDQLFDENGNICNAIYCTDIIYGHECYELTFSCKTKVISDKDHLWQLKSNLTRKNKWELFHPLILTTEEIFKNFKKTENNWNRFKYSIPLSKCIKYNEKNLSIHPYLLGIWLGDEHSAGSRITCNDQEIMDNILNLGYQVFKNKAPYIYNITTNYRKSNKFLSNLKKMNLINNKHIPCTYKISSESQRLELVKGLMDSDGSSTGKGNCVFGNKNEQLIDDLIEILFSLGIKANKSSTTAKLYNKNCGIFFNINFTTDIPIFKLERKLKHQNIKFNPVNNYRSIVNVKKVDSVPVKCIKVNSPNGLFLITNNFIPTHNTTTAFTIFSLFKRKGIPAEIIPEYARIFIADQKALFYSKSNNPYPYTLIDGTSVQPDNRPFILTNELQVEILLEQLRLEKVMKSTCDPSIKIISDSSAINALFYMSEEFISYELIQNKIKEMSTLYDKVFYLPIFKESFNNIDSNRIHNLEESIKIDNSIFSTINKYLPNLKIIILNHSSERLTINNILEEICTPEEYKKVTPIWHW